MAARKSRASKTELLSQTDPRAPLAFDAFLGSAQKALKSLAADLLGRADASESVTQALRARWQGDFDQKRTADGYDVYRRRVVGQVAAAWLLSLVFVRTLEDRGLVPRARIAGPGALDSQRQFFELAPYLNERDYLLTVFRELSNLEAARDLFDPRHDLVWKLAPSPDGARALLDLFRAPNAEAPVHRFGQSDTRFLGDLYQLLDEDVRERFALLQTPRFVESFILDRTLERSVVEFGLDATTLIDPTCGSGHFLLGAFDRLFEHQLRQNPSIDVRKAVERALGAVHGVDINPYAVAIARFRLTLVALERGGWQTIESAPRLPLNLVVADSLLHRVEAGQGSLGDLEGQSAVAWKGEQFALDDEGGAKDILAKRYAVVVGNPPYITVKDAALRERYRAAYPRSAAGKYSLGAPFTERFFDLARERGFAGMITANSFMKREFGKRLIEDYLKSVNLELIVNTSGAYIPGHGTPTVLLFGRRERSAAAKVLAVLAKRGEPTTPEDPEQGVVWRSVADHFAEVGFENDYVSVSELERSTIEKHPWSLGGGGAAELKELIEERASGTLQSAVASIGVFGMSNADDCMWAPRAVWVRRRVEGDFVRALVVGEDIRDWSLSSPLGALFPYTPPARLISAAEAPELIRFLWPFRTTLWNRATFGGGTYLSERQPWWKWHQVTESRVGGWTISFAFVATHNHFVLDRGGRVFNRSAPIIKLPEGATEEDHLALLGYLNSSTACFWMKQVFFPKATATGDVSVEKGKPEANRYEFAGTGLLSLPVPPLTPEQRTTLVRLAREADSLASSLTDLSPALAVRQIALGASREDAETELYRRRALIEAALVYVQEEIDWLVYLAFGLVRVYEECGVRRLVASDRPYVAREATAEVWRSRWEMLKESADLQLVETPVYKRPWWGRQGVFGHNTLSPAQHIVAAAFEHISASVEDLARSSAQPLSAGALLRRITSEEDIRVIESLNGDPSIAIAAILLAGCVPFAAAYRYTASGHEKRAAWLETWAEQRREDDGTRAKDAPPIAVPPKYDSKDYADATSWRLRGKLDVPKERFISYPGCASDEDGSPVYGWAGWNHLQQAQALASLYQNRKTDEGWAQDRLIPMLAGLDELVPWIIQWHNEPNAEFGGLRLGDYFRDFVASQCQELGVSLDEVRAWRPTSGKGSRGRGRTAKPEKPGTEE